MADGLLPWAAKLIKKRNKKYKSLMDALGPAKPKVPTTPAPKPVPKGGIKTHHSAADGSYLTSRKKKFGVK